MDYSLGMHQVVVFARDRDGAERTIRRELEQRLGGAAAVVEAFLSAGGATYGATAPATDATGRWRTAELAALDAAHLAFPALILRLVGEELEEALAEEHLTVGAPGFPP